MLSKTIRPVRLAAFAAMLVLAAAFLAAAPGGKRGQANADGGEALPAPPFRELTAQGLVAEMGVGWNYGNRFDAGSETGWGNPKATQEFFNRVHDMGYNTVRVPVTWSGNLGNSAPYTLNQTYLDRVQDVVDYIVGLDMFAVVNMHHDSSWQNSALNAYRDQGAGATTWVNAKNRFAAGWRQIAERFTGYGEHLLFESMNEVAGNNASVNGVRSDTRALVELNQIFTDEVRGTGGNNEKRWLVVCGRYTNIDTAADKSNGFKFPDDPLNAANKFMFSIHDYDNELGLSNPGLPGYTRAQALAYSGQIQKLIDGYASQNIPIFFGEYGAGDKTWFQPDNDKACAYWFEMMNAYFKKSMAVGCVWDNGGMANSGPASNDQFAVIDRNTGLPHRPYVVDASLRGYYCYDNVALNRIYNAIGGDGSVGSPSFTPVKAVAGVTLSKSSLNLRVGSDYRVSATASPADNNDPLVWTSSDPSVATVYEGLVRAKGIGTATITAYAQSARDNGRAVKATLTATVCPDGSLSSGGSIEVAGTAAVTGALWTSSNGATWQTAGVAQPKAELNAAASGIRRGDTLIYRSSNPGVVSVNAVGKLVGVSAGTSYVSVSTRSGLEKKVLVTVGSPSGGADVAGLTASGAVALSAANPTAAVTATATSADADERIYFESSNNGVAMPVSRNAVELSAGTASMGIVAVGNGSATVTAYSDRSGKTCAFAVTVAGFTPAYDDERIDRNADPSDIAPTVTIDMPNSIAIDWLAKINYTAATANPDAAKPLEITMNVSLDGFESVALKNGCFIPNAYGAYRIRVKAEDEFGNSAFAAHTLNVTVGSKPVKTPPAVAFDMPATVPKGTETEIKFDVASAASLPASYEFEISITVEHGESPVAVTKTGGKYFFTPDAAGAYTVKVTAEDGYGSTGTQTFGLTVLENAVPVDKTALQSKYDAVKDTQKGEFTDASWAEFQSKLTAAKAVLDDADASQSGADDALAALDTAFAGLVKKAGCGNAASAAIILLTALGAALPLKKRN